MVDHIRVPSHRREITPFEMGENDMSALIQLRPRISSTLALGILGVGFNEHKDSSDVTIAADRLFSGDMGSAYSYYDGAQQILDTGRGEPK